MKKVCIFLVLVAHDTLQLAKVHGDEVINTYYGTEKHIAQSRDCHRVHRKFVNYYHVLPM